MRWFPCLLFLPFFMTSCQPNAHFEQTYQFENKAWAHSDTLDFTFSIEDTTQRFDIALDIEHTTTYSKQNLYVQFHTRFPSGQRLSKLVSLELANKAGVWYGRCNADDCQVRIPLQNNAYFNEPGTYTITVEQYTREKDLPGVHAMGLAILPSQSENQ